MPYEKLYGVRPDVSHLHTFGALCAIVEPKERLKMLEERATMCFFSRSTSMAEAAIGFETRTGLRLLSQEMSSSSRTARRRPLSATWP